MTRTVLIALLFALHLTSATIDVSGIPEKLHKLTEMKTAALHSAAAKLQDLKETAAYNIKHLADDIDLNNLHKLDILQIRPILQMKYKLLKDFYNKPATKVNVVHIYGDELSSHFDHHAKLIHHDHHEKLIHHDHHPKLIHHDHHADLIHHDHNAKLIHHDHHTHHGHHGHHGHHAHYHDLPPWVLVGAHI